MLIDPPKLTTTNNFETLEQGVVNQAVVENEQEAKTKQTQIKVQKTIKTKISSILAREKAK